MSHIFDMVIKGKDIKLLDVCNIEPFIDGLMKNAFQQYSVLSVKRDFPFTTSFKNTYIDVLTNQFRAERDMIKETILTCGKSGEQVFETEVLLGENMGYIRYVFPISYANMLISQVGLEPKEFNVESLHEFSKHIELDKDYQSTSDEPIIILSYPQSFPNFFVLDGNHRVEKAYEKNQKTIKGYFLPEGALPLLAPQKLFSVLSTVHLNLTLIGLYMVGDIILSQLKEWYKPISNEEWIS